jgi:hypothetical protein
MQTLNGQGGQTQTFSNDTNIGISSAGNVHTLNWSGLLGIDRGGTGTSTFASGGLIFSDGTNLTQNPNQLFWDDTNGYLGIGTSSPGYTLDVVGTALFSGVLTITEGQDFILNQGTLSGQPGNIRFNDENNDILGEISFERGLEEGGGITLTNNTGGINSWGMVINLHNQVGIGTPAPEGDLQIAQNGSATVYVGSSSGGYQGQTPGCIVMGDSDGVGVTYVTANDGVLSATITKPSNCQ